MTPNMICWKKCRVRYLYRTSVKCEQSCKAWMHCSFFLSCRLNILIGIIVISRVRRYQRRHITAFQLGERGYSIINIVFATFLKTLKSKLVMIESTSGGGSSTSFLQHFFQGSEGATTSGR